MNDDNFIDATKLTLQEWLEIVYNPPAGKIFNRSFPTEKLRNEYLDGIQNRSHDEVTKLLKSMLIKSSSFGLIDEIRFQGLTIAHENNPELFNNMISHTYYQRLVKYFKISEKIYPWEGNTWILDLLPRSPKIALEGLNAYLFANIPVLPDVPLQCLFDVAEIIRAKYIGLPGTQVDKVEFLQGLSSRQFENLAERLYDRLEYETELTQPTRDGGRDVIAKIDNGIKNEILIVECKRYTGSVGFDIVQRLNGALHHDRANRGVVITSGRFTVHARKLANECSIQLIDGEKFVRLLNEHLGTNWTQKIDRIIAESEKHYQETKR